MPPVFGERHGAMCQLEQWFVRFVVEPRNWSGWQLTSLHNHLRNTLTTEGLAADKGLALDTGKQVAKSSQQQEDSSGNQAACTADIANELQSRHDAVGGCAHIIGRDLANRLIELAGGWADSEKKRDLDEKNDKGRCDSKGAEDNANYIKRKDVGDSNSQTDDHGKNSKPLSVDAEVSRLELLLERHLASLRRAFVFGLGAAEKESG